MVFTRCNVFYFPAEGEKVKRANKLETPGAITDSLETARRVIRTWLIVLGKTHDYPPS
jgi:hypothetical protein